MATNTPKSFNNLVIYEVYVRNHSPEGTFTTVTADLPRLKSMGVDVVWFMPIHPIGVKAKKGSLGCPYSITDYREVNPEYGTLSDFQALIAAAHKLGMKVMIDVVYNHTAHDAIYVSEHPNWYHQDENGQPFTTVPAWSDIIDLLPGDPALEDYLVGSLVYWVQQGVDGFRCDVASVVPMQLWERARAECAKINPNTMWLAESVHASFVEWRRRDGLSGVSDGELYSVFDMTYDYDIWSIWEAAVSGDLPIDHYLGALRIQDGIYPATYVKMRAVENHDQPRIMRRAKTREQALAWTAFMGFNKGAFLLYGGQESEATHTPSLFDIDKVAWGNYELQSFLTKLCGLKKDAAQVEGLFTLLLAEPAIVAKWETDNGGLLGVFNVRGNVGQVSVGVANGVYEDVLNGGEVVVESGKMGLPQHSVIIRYKEPFDSKLVSSPLLDYHFSGD